MVQNKTLKTPLSLNKTESETHSRPVLQQPQWVSCSSGCYPGWFTTFSVFTSVQTLEGRGLVYAFQNEKHVEWFATWQILTHCETTFHFFSANTPEMCTGPVLVLTMLEFLTTGAVHRNLFLHISSLINKPQSSPRPWMPLCLHRVCV